MKNNQQLNPANKASASLQREAGNNPRLKRAGLVAIIIILSGAVFYGLFREKAPYFEYVIKPVSGPEKVLEVWLTIHHPHSDGNIFSLYKSEINLFDLSCEDNRGAKLAIDETDGTIQISTGQSNLIKVFYRVKIAQLGKHGYRGQYYNNLLTFDGEQTLLFPPEVASNDDRAIRQSIGRITLKTIYPADWEAVIPFTKKGLFKTGSPVTELNHPSWSKIYDLAKSAYTFGRLIKHPCPGEKLLSIYVDPEAQKFYNHEVATGLKSIYEYYAGLFGYRIPYSVVILRKNPFTDQYMIGGSSTQTLSATFDPNNPRDWQLMSHRFFHAFFEHKITSAKFHFPPQLWFYEGLATYYENMSMTGLPDSINKKPDLDISRNFLMLFKRYLYMRLKDPGLLAIAPMNEEAINSTGQIEFLHYTQAPLIIKYMEDLSFLSTGVHDRILKFILYNNPEEFNLQSVVQFALKDKAPGFAGQYLLNADILPLWYLSGNLTEDSRQVINELNDFEYTLWTWFRLENPGYPKDELKADGLAGQADEAERAGLKFAGDNIESQVKELSPTVYRLLKQYALRAEKAGVDFDDPQLRFKVIGTY